jgi:uncharacterized protein YndB with AHSA1/START domain
VKLLTELRLFSQELFQVIYEIREMSIEIESQIVIHAVPSVVWNYLTMPELMKKWMGDEEMQLEVLTEWNINGPIVIKGFHHEAFINKGTILMFQPEVILQYTHLSSLSELNDRIENYTILTFALESIGSDTLLKIKIVNFPTDSIYRHMALYWNATVSVIKDTIEAGK